MVVLRQTVFWFGASPDEKGCEEFANRGLVLDVREAGSDLPSLATAIAAVFAFDADNFEIQSKVVIQLAERLLDYGIRVEIVTPDDQTTGAIQTTLTDRDLLGRLSFSTAPPPFAIPEKAARHPSGPSPRLDLVIEVARDREPLATGDIPLFQRAFAHCKKVVLVELTGGRSDARVFAVHMTVDTSVAGVWPQPFFAKVDVHEKIKKEFGNYREFADRFIPFGLRPNVQEIVPGSRRSLLVGDFVDRSDSLWELAQRNVAAQAISNLVEETLVGWRNQAYAEDATEGSVARAMVEADIARPDGVKQCYVDHARQAGVDAPACELWRNLLSLVGQKYRQAPIHGDLHGENVRVRNGQAILIDLASVSPRGPLTADLAALETWLAFELPPGEDKAKFANPTWQEEIDRLYGIPAFQHPPGPCDPTSEYCWMTSVVRQIRHLGLAAQSCPSEYQTAVAVQLLRRSQWEDGPPADRFRRARGYIAAAVLVKDLTGRSAT